MLVRVAAWCIAVPIMAWVVSGWFWDLTAPARSPMTWPAANPDPQAVAQGVALRHLFGDSGAGQAGATPAGVPYRIVGLMTASREAPGFAILAKDGMPPVVALEGDTIEPGVTLVQVLPKQARLLANGRSETLDAPDVPSSSPVAKAPIGRMNSAPPDRVAGAPEPGIRSPRPRP